MDEPTRKYISLCQSDYRSARPWYMDYQEKIKKEQEQSLIRKIIKSPGIYLNKLLNHTIYGLFQNISLLSLLTIMAQKAASQTFDDPFLASP